MLSRSPSFLGYAFSVFLALGLLATPAFGAATLDYRLSSSGTILQASSDFGATPAPLDQHDGDAYSTPGATGTGIAAYGFAGFGTNYVATDPASGANATAITEASNSFTGVSGSAFSGFIFEADAYASAQRDPILNGALGRGEAWSDHHVFFTLATPHYYAIDIEGTLSLGLVGLPQQNYAVIDIELRQSSYDPITGLGSMGAIYESETQFRTTDGGQAADLNLAGTLPAGTYWFRARNATGIVAVDMSGQPMAGDGQSLISSGSFSLTPVPEPTSLALLSLGGLAVLRRKRA